MNFTYENQGHITYLSYAIAPEDVVDTMSLGMITNNKIHGLAPSIFTQMDTTKYIKYNVSAKISVQQFFSGAVAKKHLLGVFDGIIAAIMAAEDYMIDINSIVFDLNYIFADVSTCEVSLICLPIQAENTGAFNLNSFFKNIMFSTQFDQSENCDYVAKIINYLNSSPVFSLEDFKSLLDTLKGTTNSTSVVAPVQQNIEQPVVNTIVKPQVEAQATQPVVPVNNQVANKDSMPVQTTIPPVQPTVVPPVQKVPTPPVMPNVTPKVPPVPQKKDEAQAKKKGGFFGLFSHSAKSEKKDEKKVPQSRNVKPPIPAQTSPNGFAIPGQKVPVQSNGNGFAVPGQATPSVNNTPVQPVAPTKKEEVPAAQPQPAVQKPVAQQPAYQPPVVPQSQSMNFGETTVLGGGSMGETTVLGVATATVKENPHLIRVKNNEKINLNKPVFRIGKEKSYVDYFIGDNTAISRSHANFITREGEYFVTDTNSTNHTYVNGVMIQSNVETKLADGDKVRLANEDFEFKLY